MALSIEKRQAASFRHRTVCQAANTSDSLNLPPVVSCAPHRCERSLFKDSAGRERIDFVRSRWRYGAVETCERSHFSRSPLWRRKEICAFSS